MGVSIRFPLGKFLMTRGVNDRVAEDTPFAKFVTDSLKRHAGGHWGDMSAYEHKTLPKIWIITEADRSATTILFPDEY